MTSISAAAFSQQQFISLTKTTEVSVERSISALSAGASLTIGQGEDAGDPFARVFDVIDISEDAQEKLIQDREDAERLADLLKGLEPEYEIGTPRNFGRIQVDFSAIQVTERFSFTQSYELSFLQETSFAVNGEDANFEVTRSSLQEVSFSQTVEYERTTSLSSLNGSISIAA